MPPSAPSRRRLRPPSASSSTGTRGSPSTASIRWPYFCDGKPVPGRQDSEHGHAGAIWRFDNEGNRAAFAADPDVYMPRYGGYDPVGIGRGLATPGFPAVWIVFDQRLYLFYTPEARQTFIADPASVIASASARWTLVKSDLVE